MPRKSLDWSKTGTLEAMAKWIQEDGDCICVLAIRAHDSVFIVDPQCKPEDAAERVMEYLPHLAGRVDEARRLKKAGARLVHGGDGDLAELLLTPE